MEKKAGISGISMWGLSVSGLILLLALGGCEFVTVDPVGEADSAKGDDTSKNNDDEPGSSDAEPGSSDDEPGSSDDEPGSSDAEPGSSDDEPGSSDAEPGSSDAEPGSSDENLAGCGNSVLESHLGEMCDDGNRVNFDGCSATCELECGLTCDTLGNCAPACDRLGIFSCNLSTNILEYCCVSKPDETPAADPSCADYLDSIDTDTAESSTDTDVALAVCGNGVLEAGETCDDGNIVPLDGCSGTCRRECDYICDQPGDPCTPDCTLPDMTDCWFIPAREACCDGKDWETIEDSTLSSICQTYSLEQQDTSVKALVFDGTTWLYKGDRQIKEEARFAATGIADDADYLPVPDGSEYRLAFSSDGQSLLLSAGTVSLLFLPVSIETQLISDEDGRLTYEWVLAPGGRIDIWVNEQNEYQVEITAYGSGVPIINSERGTIQRITME